MKPVFRSEAFIVPILNRGFRSDANDIDDVKISKIQQSKPFGRVKSDESATEICKSVVQVDKDDVGVCDVDIDFKKSCDLNLNVCVPVICVNDVEVTNEEKNPGKEETVEDKLGKAEKIAEKSGYAAKTAGNAGETAEKMAKTNRVEEKFEKLGKIAEEGEEKSEKPENKNHKAEDIKNNNNKPVNVAIKDEKLNEEIKEETLKAQNHNSSADFLAEPIYDVPFSSLRNNPATSNNLRNSRLQKEEEKKLTDDIIAQQNIPEEPIYDVPYFANKRPEPVKLRERFETGEYVSLQMISKQKPKHNKFFPRPPMRTSSLMSIDERGETPDNCNDDFCCHGYKNGCTAVTKKPEEVTEGIFEVNWMKRLEQLRAREAVIKEKEALLFDREKLLFKKEKELRIVERLLKDKLKHAELYLKRFKSQSNELVDPEIEKKNSDLLHPPSNDYPTHVRSLENLETFSKTDKRLVEDVNRELVTHEILKSCGSLNSGVGLNDEKIMKNPPNSRSSLMTASSIEFRSLVAKSESGNSHFTKHSGHPGFSAYSSTRIKKKPKISYDDLDSTLSADVGDSSFVVTSRKFDPEVFKKPYAFTRTLSDRRPKPEKLPDCQYEEEKLLKRFSDNIFGSYDGNTKFQNYGLIDVNTRTAAGEGSKSTIDRRRHSHLNLEDEKKSKSNSKSKKEKKSKERPISWNEETNEWLQKKRQAYNSQNARRIMTECFENKENSHGSHVKLNNPGHLKVKSKEKKFNIFR